MPSASGRYQSRLFNFIYRQSQRFGDRVGETLRHAKLTAGWSLQSLVVTILSPIQWAINNAGRQLAGGQERVSLRQLDGTNDAIFPDAEVPILNVLGHARTLPSYQHHAVRTGINKPLTNTINPTQYVPHLRGIACQIADKALVLVNSANEILNILSPQEQQKLTDKIIGETAEYYTAQQQFAAHTKEHHCALAEIDQILTKLTADTSQANLQLPPNSEPHSPDHPPHSLEMIDAVVARFENVTIVPVANTTTSLVHQLGDAIYTFVHSKITHTVDSRSNPSVTSVDSHETELNPIQKLIWGAVHYFFGNKNTSSRQINSTPQTNPQTAIPLTGNSIHQPLLTTNSDFANSDFSRANYSQSDFTEENIDDPWLTANELFGEVIPVVTEKIEAAIAEYIVENQTVENITSENSTTETWTSTKSLPGQPPSTHKLPPSYYQPITPPRYSRTPTLITSTRRNRKIQDRHRASSEWKEVTEFSTELTKAEDISSFEQLDFGKTDFGQDWIEINASTVGYDKHPLEQILQWLDRVMAWLEAKIVGIVKSLWNWWKAREY